MNNFKLLCVTDNKYATEGEIIEFIGGRTTWKNGSKSCIYNDANDFLSSNLNLSESFINVGNEEFNIPKTYKDTTLIKVDCIEPQIRPYYYNNSEITPFDYIKANNLDFFEGNVIKYITRHKAKNGLEDLLKARTYLDEMIKDYQQND